MKKFKLYLLSVGVLFANNSVAMDGVEYLESLDFVAGFTISSTSLDLTFNLQKNFLLNMKGRWLEHDEKLSLTPDYQVQFGDGRHLEWRFKPVIFKSQHKGFRIVYWVTGAFVHRHTPVITYIALSDTPIKVDEEDVEMVMDDGKWVKIEDSKSLLIDKLGWGAELILLSTRKDKPIPKMILDKLDDPYYGPIIRTLAEHGFIKLPSEEIITETPLEILKKEPETQLENENVQTNDANAWVADEKTSRENTLSCRPACRAWLWWFAFLPVTAGAWFVVHFLKK